MNFQPDQVYFEELQKIVKDFQKRHGYSEEQILGIGLGMQGLTSPDGSEMTYGKILDCTGLSIRMFADYFSVPCRFIHDAECASVSELWENPKISDAIYLSVGQHLGGAVIIHGELQRGLTGKTGTFEHMTLIQDGAECYCGKKGCAECYCSGHFLTNQNMEIEEFFARKEQGDQDCQKRWDAFLQYLSMLIHNVHMVVESTVILGGNITGYFTEQDIDVIKKYGGAEVITIEEELKNIENYLMIQQERYSDILQYKIWAQEECLQYKIPKMTLQPLVENAIYHGLKERGTEGHIVIEAQEKNGGIQIAVRDDGVGLAPDKFYEILNQRNEKKEHFGVKNVHERIKLYFGDSYGLVVDEEQKEGLGILILMLKVEVYYD